MFSKTTLDEVRRSAPIHEVAAPYVEHLRKVGTRYLGICPFHEEKTPSFSLSPEQGLYYCFGCQRGGNAFQLVEALENIPFPEAVRRLAERFGVALPEEKEEKGQGAARTSALVGKEALARAVKGALAAAAQHFAEQLVASSEGREMLEALIDEEHAAPPERLADLGLGFAPTGGHEALREAVMAKEHELAALEAAGLDAEGYDYLRGRIVCPVFEQGAGRKKAPRVPSLPRAGSACIVGLVAWSLRAEEEAGPGYGRRVRLLRDAASLFVGLPQAEEAIEAAGEAVVAPNFRVWARLAGGHSRPARSPSDGASADFDAVSLRAEVEQKSCAARAVAPLTPALTEQQARHLASRAPRVLLLWENQPMFAAPGRTGKKSRGGRGKGFSAPASLTRRRGAPRLIISRSSGRILGQNDLGAGHFDGLSDTIAEGFAAGLAAGLTVRAARVGPDGRIGPASDLPAFCLSRAGDQVPRAAAAAARVLAAVHASDPFVAEGLLTDVAGTLGVEADALREAVWHMQQAPART